MKLNKVTFKIWTITFSFNIASLYSYFYLYNNIPNSLENIISQDDSPSFLELTAATLTLYGTPSSASIAKVPVKDNSFKYVFHT